MDNFEKIKSEVLACQKCPLYIEREKNNFFAVPGEGTALAKIVFVGEAPGLNEAKTGRPFCGAAGKILDELLESTGIKREEVYITNIVKDRPPENRNPKPEEIIACSPYLDRQIECIKPEVVCTLGNFSTSYVMERYGLKEEIQGISKIHGKVFDIGTLFGKMKIVPLYHPAVATYNINMKKVLEDDFKILKNLL
ncbi:MAG: uracil-DNA glycosylase [bacterium]|nr:uracil-DNA glycosylase [bacterium]